MKNMRFWLRPCLAGVLLPALLAALASGCVSEQAASDWQWKHANPGWQSTSDPDPRPQWGVPFWPRSQQMP